MPFTNVLRLTSERSRDVLEALGTGSDIDLVVLGIEDQHRKGGMRLRPDSQRILQHCPCSVFLSPSAIHTSEAQNVLCIVDAIGPQPATEAACELVESGGCITLLYVHEKSLFELASPRHIDADDVHDELEALDALATTLEACCDADVIPVHRAGRPTVEVLDVLGEDHFDLVVMGPYKRRLARKVVQSARCPVLFAHGRSA